jgi:predicted aconitase with swiveling domain
MAANFVMHIADQMKKEGVAPVAIAVAEREEVLAVQ